VGARRLIGGLLVAVLTACDPGAETAEPKWVAMPVPAKSALRAIHGTSTSDVWAVGADGVVLHFDGTDWKSMNLGMPTNLTGVWASSPTDVWLVGEGGAVFRYDGRSFNKLSVLGVTDTLEHVIAGDQMIIASSSRAWTTDGTDASLWKRQKQLGDTSSYIADVRVTSIAGTRTSGLWMITEGEVFAAKPNSSVFSAIAIGTRDAWEVVAPASSTDVWLASSSKVLHYDGNSWKIVALPSVPTTASIRAGASPSEGHTWLVGDHGLILHATSAGLVAEAHGGYSGPRLHGVWGATPNDVWAVGDKGWVLRRR
jgi:hypothetical protein